MLVDAGTSEQCSNGNQSMRSDLQSQLQSLAAIIKVTPHSLLHPLTLLTNRMKLIRKSLLPVTHLCPNNHPFSTDAQSRLCVCVCAHACVKAGSVLKVIT
jgi:hypothetical protein